MKEKFEPMRCKMSDGIVPYMYQEMTSADRRVFEEHLESCPECVDEFAEIADARFSVYEWRKVEFEAMRTPEIVIPYETGARISWFGKLREAFSAAPTWTAVGIPSAAAVVLAIGLFSYQSPNNGDIASNVGNAVSLGSAKSKQSNITDAPVEVESIEVADEPEIPQPAANPSAVSNPTRADRAETPQLARADRRVKPEPRRVQPERVVESRQQPVMLPTFTEFAEQEDESLRLAELFEDIGISE